MDVEQGKIRAITTYDYCIYKGVNLIGLAQEALLNLLESTDFEFHPDPVEFDDGEVNTIISFFDLRLQVWFLDGYVKFISILEYGASD